MKPSSHRPLGIRYSGAVAALNVAEALYSITRRRIAREQVKAFDLHVRGLDQGGVAIRSPARIAPNRLADALEFSHRGYGPKQLRSDGDGILWIK
jgi:hypothetical protein